MPTEVTFILNKYDQSDFIRQLNEKFWLYYTRGVVNYCSNTEHDTEHLLVNIYSTAVVLCRSTYFKQNWLFLQKFSFSHYKSYDHILDMHCSLKIVVIISM